MAVEGLQEPQAKGHRSKSTVLGKYKNGIRINGKKSVVRSGKWIKFLVRKCLEHQSGRLRLFCGDFECQTIINITT